MQMSWILPGVDVAVTALLASRMTLAMTWAAMWKMSFVLSACALKARTASALPMFGGTMTIAGARLDKPGALCASLTVLKSSKDILGLQIMPRTLAKRSAHTALGNGDKYEHLGAFSKGRRCGQTLMQSDTCKCMLLTKADPH